MNAWRTVFDTLKRWWGNGAGERQKGGRIITMIFL
jgi:hypothetical protein